MYFFSLSSLSLSVKVLQLVFFFFGLLSTVTDVEMNQLPTFGINCGLPKSEFIHHLATNSAEHLKSLRECLFDDARKANLIPPELHGLPLVGRRDTVIRPASTALSEDIWTIVTCITNKTVLPRTLIKNGKRSKQFLIDAPVQRRHPQISLPPQANRLSIHLPTTINPQLVLIQSRSLSSTSQLPISYHQVLIFQILSSPEKLTI